MELPNPDQKALMTEDDILAKESIKLVKNSRGYNWDIKLKEDHVSLETIKRLDELNNELNQRYGSYSE